MPLFSVSGTWQMNHDGWVGTLVINPPDQVLNEVDGPCAYHYSPLDGTYTNAGFGQLLVVGTVGGQDRNYRNGQQCPQADHRIDFTVAFPGAPPQPFTGYGFTHDGSRMAGYTWWQGIPFGWYAQKL